MNTADSPVVDEIVARCHELARCTEIPGQTTRLHLCPPMQEVHNKLRQWMEQAGLTVSLDGAGNLRGTRAARSGGPRRLLLGSHLDTVPNAGAFDGILGVLLGLAAIKLLAGDPLPFGIELIGFAEEEGVRFGRPLLGSLALVGALDDDALSLRDHNKVTVRESLLAFGAPVHALPSAALPNDGSVLGFLEVHIEQGPVLEAAGQALGIVRAIAGQSRARLTFLGRANHAGTTPMSLRQDALAAAAAWIVAVEQLARNTPGLVATVGHIEVAPGATNVIAARCIATLDVRHVDDLIRTQSLQKILSAAAVQADERSVQLSTEILLEQPAVTMDPTLSAKLTQAAQLAGERPLSMVSGAGHDAMVLARRVPAAMLFLRSPGGLSHHPDEAVLHTDVAAALATTVHFLRLLGDDEAETLPNEG